MPVSIVRSDARHLPLPENSVDLIVTSPPYFALRSYQDNGEHYAGQIGSEATPAEFIDALIACTAEWVRVLKPSGSIFVNLGDKYNSAASGQNGLGTSSLGASKGPGNRASTERYAKRMNQSRGASLESIPNKSLMGLPWRYALRCIDDLGLILRAEVVWSKPNGLPESVTDRVRRSHEQWFHFTRLPRYYAAVDTIREPQAFPNHGQIGHDPRGAKLIGMPDGHHDRPAVRALNPLGKLPGSVWSIPSQPLTVPKYLVEQDGALVEWIDDDEAAWRWIARTGADRNFIMRGFGLSLVKAPDHFAAFPMAWPRQLIQGWSPSGICVRCGEGRRPVVENVGGNRGQRGYIPSDDRFLGRTQRSGPGSGALTQLKAVTGEVCGCTAPVIWRTTRMSGTTVIRDTPVPDPSWVNSAPTRPAVVLDPFGGTGTVALVADVLGRHGISVDMSADYCRLARWRTTDPGQRAAAMQVEKPEPVPDGQMGLFG